MECLHGFPVIPIPQVGVGESAFNETPQDSATSRPKSACGENKAGNLAGRSFVTKEDDPLPCNKSVEQDDDRVCLRTIGVQMRMQRTSDLLIIGKDFDEGDQGVLVNVSQGM